MKITNAFQGSFMRLFILTLTIYFFSSCSKQSNNIEGIIDGTYDLVEWSQNNSTYNAPDVSGRIVFMHGNLSLTIHKRFDPENYFTFVGYGDYKFENGKFALKYINSLTLKGDQSHNYTGNTKTSFGGGQYRWYIYELKEEGLFMTTEDGKQQLNIFNNGNLVYKDLNDLSGVSMTRTWKKVN